MISGHSTSDALKILHDELKTEYDKFNQKKRSLPNYLTVCLTQKGFLVNGAHLILMLVCSCLLIISFNLLETKECWLLIQGLLLLFFTILNGLLLYHDLHEHQHITNKKVTRLLEHIQELSNRKTWNQTSFPQLHVPTSQSISLQWTIRDSEVVGLPVCLMVEGDVMLLRPGQHVSVKCSPLEETEVCVRGVMKHQHSSTSQRFSSPPSTSPPSSNQSSTTSSQLQPFLVLETPFLPIFRAYLNSSVVRVCSQLENTRHRIFNLLYHQKFLPLLLLIMLTVNILRHILLPSYTAPLIYMVVVLQIECMFPLLPSLFPLCWRLVDLLGICQLSLFERAIYQDPLNTHPSATTWGILRCLTSHTPLLPAPINTTHIVGSITSMCCVDKKGLLSWPIPTAEKVFFLTTHSHPPPHHSPIDEFTPPKNDALVEANCHVLNLTQDARSQHELTFDDNSWREHLSSLKPIGLNVLLNCCNSSTLDRYTHFSDHINHLSHQHSKYIPVVNRRCLCELSRQIGFSTHAHKLFRTHEMFGVLNTTEREVRGGGGRRYKMPYPNMFVVKLLDASTGTHQLQSQGTAELLLQHCTHYWDGHNVRVLGVTERKRISDFYQRTSMTSYCTAFAYKPLLPCPKSPASFVIDLPEVVDLSHSHGGRGSLQARGSRFPSTNTDLHKAWQADKYAFFGNQIFLGMVTMQYRAVENVVTLIENLESRCIKFVHFSMENELRSRVFSEKMGLEAGWNCHISLLEEGEDEGCEGGDVGLSVGGGVYDGARDSCDDYDERRRLMFSGIGRVLSMGLNRLGYQADEESGSLLWQASRRHLQHQHRSVPLLHHRSSLFSPPATSPSNDGVSPFQSVPPKPLGGTYSKNPSLTLEHSIEEINDIQNRAQLPKGIQQIRPHLEHTDNVPLQVSLFTDCTPHTTNQMFDILHEYNEVVACVGSSLNVHNVQAFITADCSFSISPMHPEICVMDRRGGEFGVRMDGMGDMGDITMVGGGRCDDAINEMTSLASMMISLPSTMLLHHQHISQLTPLISLASKHLQKVQRSSKVFFTLLCTLTTLQLLTTIFLLPPSLPPPLLTWMCMIVVPSLSLSLMFNPDFSQIPYVKHGQFWEKFIKRTFLRESFYFTLRFIPSLIFILLLFAFNLHHACIHHHHHHHHHLHHHHHHHHSNDSLLDTTHNTSLIPDPPTTTTTLLHHLSTPNKAAKHQSQHDLNDNDLGNTTITTTNATTITTNFTITTTNFTMTTYPSHRCHPFIGASNNHSNNHSTTTSQWLGHNTCTLLVSQHIASLQITMLFVIVTLSNIHPLEFSCKKSPFRNPCCSVVALAVLVIQVIWFVTETSMTSCDVTSVSVVTWCLLPVWLVCSCALHEAVKAKEINIWIRHQKRAKLDFGTKLGMNSPF